MDWLKENKGKVALFVIGVVIAGAVFWLGGDVDFSALVTGDVSELGQDLEDVVGQ